MFPSAEIRIEKSIKSNSLLFYYFSYQLENRNNVGVQINFTFDGLNRIIILIFQPSRLVYRKAIERTLCFEVYRKTFMYYLFDVNWQKVEIVKYINHTHIIPSRSFKNIASDH